MCTILNVICNTKITAVLHEYTLNKSYHFYDVRSKQVCNAANAYIIYIQLQSIQLSILLVKLRICKI